MQKLLVMNLCTKISVNRR